MPKKLFPFFYLLLKNTFKVTLLALILFLAGPLHSQETQETQKTQEVIGQEKALEGEATKTSGEQNSVVPLGKDGTQIVEAKDKVEVKNGRQSSFADKLRQVFGNDNRNFYYTLNMDIGFLLGFNGTKMVADARKKVFLIEPVTLNGDLLRYGFSATANFGLVWPLGLKEGLKKAANENTTNIIFNESQATPKKNKRRIPYKLRSPEPKIPYKWSIGFQLRNMISVGQTSFIFNNQKNSPHKFYNQQDLRAFYAFQPVFYLSWILIPTWELSLHLGPSFNWNFYQRTNEVFSWQYSETTQVEKTERTTDSPWLNTFSLGAVMGLSFSHYFYSFLSTGISTQFVLNLSPYDGNYSIGQFVFGLYVQFIF